MNLLERIKLGLIASHEYARTLLLWLAVVAVLIAVYALWTFRNTQQMVGATNAEIKDTIAELRGTVKALNSKIAAVDAEKINRQADDLHNMTVAGTAFIDGLDTSTRRVTSAATARLDQLGENLTSVKSVTDTTATQISSIGSESTKRINDLGKLEANLTDAVATANSELKARSTDLGEAIDTINARLKDKRLDAFLDTLPASGGNVSQITANLAGMTGRFKEASDEAPEIAKLWKQMMATSKRFQKALIFARIVGLVEPLFQPLVGGLP